MLLDCHDQAAERGYIFKDDFLEAMAAPVAITETLCSKFATLSKRGGKPVISCPQMNKDRILCFVLVLGMHVSNNEFHLTALAKDLRVNEAFLVKYVRQTGMKVVKKKGEVGDEKAPSDSSERTYSVAMLERLPLEFPGPPRRQQGK